MARVAVPGCPVCGDKWDYPWILAAGFPLVFCMGGCGHRYSKEVLGEEALAGTYYNEDEATLEARGNMASKRARFTEYEAILGGLRPGLRVLDVGCNTGELLSLFKEKGCEVAGVEVSPGPARLARKRLGAQVWEGRVEDVLPAGETFDVVALAHVLEHIHQPVALLERLKSALRPGGKLLVEVPNAEDLGVHVWGGRYRSLCPGDHVSFFTEKSLDGALQRAGLHVQAKASPTHARDIFYTWLLSAVDVARQRRTQDVDGVMHKARYRGGLRRPLRAAIDAVVPMLDPLVAYGMARLPPYAQGLGTVLIAVASA